METITGTETIKGTEFLFVVWSWTGIDSNGVKNFKLNIIPGETRRKIAKEYIQSKWENNLFQYKKSTK